MAKAGEAKPEATETPAPEVEAGVIAGPDTVTYAPVQELPDGRFRHSASRLGTSLNVDTDSADTRSPRAALRKALADLTGEKE